MSQLKVRDFLSNKKLVKNLADKLYADMKGWARQFDDDDTHASVMAINSFPYLRVVDEEFKPREILKDSYSKKPLNKKYT